MLLRLLCLLRLLVLLLLLLLLLNWSWGWAQAARRHRQADRQASKQVGCLIGRQALVGWCGDGA